MVSRFPAITAVYKAALPTNKKQNFRTSKLAGRLANLGSKRNRVTPEFSSKILYIIWSPADSMSGDQWQLVGTTRTRKYRDVPTCCRLGSEDEVTHSVLHLRRKSTESRHYGGWVVSKRPCTWTLPVSAFEIFYFYKLFPFWPIAATHGCEEFSQYRTWAQLHRHAVSRIFLRPIEFSWWTIKIITIQNISFCSPELLLVFNHGLLALIHVMIFLSFVVEIENARLKYAVRR